MPGRNRSRRGTKNMRKNTDIADLETALEERREEVRQRGGELDELADSELFVVDAKGDGAAAPRQSRRGKREPWFKRKLREMQRGNMEPVGTKNVTRAKHAQEPQRKMKYTKETLSKAQALLAGKFEEDSDSETEYEGMSEALQQYLVQRMQTKRTRQERPLGTHRAGKKNKKSLRRVTVRALKENPDMLAYVEGKGWAEDEDGQVAKYGLEHISRSEAEPEEETRNPWKDIPRVRDNRFVRKLQEARKKGLNEVAAVEVHAGASYVPDKEAHQRLLAQEVARDLAAEERREKLRAQLDVKHKFAHEAEPDDLTSQMLGVRTDVDPTQQGAGVAGDSDSESEDESEEEDWGLATATAKEKLQPVQGKRKTRRQRNKEKAAAEKEAARLEAKKRKREAHEVAQAKHNGQVVAQKLAEREAKRQRRMEAAAERERTLPKRLGKRRYREPKQEVLMTTELPSSLRSLKPQGSVLADRYDSLLRRNIVEPRQKAKKRTPKYPKIEYDRRAVGEKARKMHEAREQEKAEEKKKKRLAKEKQRVDMAAAKKKQSEPALVW